MFSKKFAKCNLKPFLLTKIPNCTICSKFKALTKSLSTELNMFDNKSTMKSLKFDKFPHNKNKCRKSYCDCLHAGHLSSYVIAIRYIFFHVNKDL